MNQLTIDGSGYSYDGTGDLPLRWCLRELPLGQTLDFSG